MIRFRHLVLLFIALASSCGEKDKAKDATAPGAAAKTTRPDGRPARGDDDADVDPRVALRERYDGAVATADPAERERAMELVAWDGIDVDAELAHRAFEQLPPDSAASRRLVAHFAMRLAESDPDAAIEWASALEQEGERSDAMGRIAVVISATEPERGADLIAEKMPAGVTRDRAVVQVLQRWTQAAPPAASEWIAEFSPGEARSAGLKVTLGGWLQRDFSTAAAWIEARGDDALRTECLVAAAAGLRGLAEDQRAEAVAAFGGAENRKQLENLLAQPPP